MLSFTSICVALVLWIGLVALVGYAAVLTAWRSPRVP
jgi:hypothetical protein